MTTGSVSVNTLKTLVGLLVTKTWISSALKIQAGRNDVKNTIAKESKCGGLCKMCKCLEQQQSQLEQDCSLFYILGLFLVHSNAQMTWKAPALYLHWQPSATKRCLETKQSMRSRLRVVSCKHSSPTLVRPPQGAQDSRSNDRITQCKQHGDLTTPNEQGKHIWQQALWRTAKRIQRRRTVLNKSSCRFCVNHKLKVLSDLSPWFLHGFSKSWPWSGAVGCCL